MTDQSNPPKPPRTKSLIEMAGEKYDFAKLQPAPFPGGLTRDAPRRMLVFDSPPALAASPAAELAQYVGQVVLVARADVTGRSALEDAISLLSTEAELYLLLNGTRFSPSGRRFGAYYSQGETR